MVKIADTDEYWIWCKKMRGVTGLGPPSSKANTGVSKATKNLVDPDKVVTEGKAAQKNAKHKPDYERELPIVEAQIQEWEKPAALSLFKDKVKDLKAKLENAKALAAKHDYAKAVGLLGEIDTACKDMQLTQDKIDKKNNAYKAKYQLVASRVQRCKDHPEHPTISAQIARMDTSLAKAQTEAGKLDFNAAKDELDDIDSLCNATRTLLDDAANWHTKYDDDFPEKKIRYEYIIDYGRKRHDANLVEKDIDTAEQTLAAIPGKAASHLWKEACDLITGIGKILDAAWIVLEKAPFPEELARAEAHLQRLKKHEFSNDIKDKIDTIEDKLKAAKVQFSSGKSRLARDLAIAAMGLCPVAEQAADAAAYKDKKAKVDTLIERLKTRNASGAIDGRLEAITGRIEETVKLANAGRHAVAVASLARVSDDCAAAKALLDKQDVSAGERKSAKDIVAAMDAEPDKGAAPDEALKAVIALAAKLVKHSQARFIAKELMDIRALIKTAQQQVKEGSIAAAKTTLSQAADNCGEANLLAERQDEFVAMHLFASGLVKKLEEHDKHADIAGLIDKVKKGITDAEAKVATRDHPAARKLLRAATDLARQAMARAEIRKKLSAAAPTAGALKELLSEPGGYEALDEVIKNLPEDTPRKVIEAALEARFGTKIEQYKTQKTAQGEALERKDWEEANPEHPGKDAKRIYELLLLVPESHVRDNEKLRRIIRFTDDRREAAYGDGIIFMNCGRSSDVPEYAVGDKKELLGGEKMILADGTELSMDPNCVPKNGGKAVYFNWATLHEVGHAVDDKSGYMRGHASNPDYGGWEEWDNPDEVAKVACKHFHLESKAGIAYATALLNGESSPDSPDKKDGVDLAVWQGYRDEVKEWVTAINAEDLWDSGGESAKRAIGKRVYQKAYSGKWNSYLLAARTKGIAGYQFRSPAEWFADLYAAYYLDRLRPAHPAVAWLKDL